MHRVTVGATPVASSPTYAGMLSIAAIYSACCIGYTAHTPSTYAGHLRRTTPPRQGVRT